jgi:membrane-anchored glycerophosphoryl diester phosphodiesterase (GDPDase)
MAKKGHKKIGDFSQFLNDPPVSTALVVFALIALFLAILEFGRALY